MSADIVQLPIRLPVERRSGDRLLYLGERIYQVDAQIRRLRELKKRLQQAYQNEWDCAGLGARHD